MSLFSWVGKLIDDMVNWLGRVARAFVKGLIWSLQRIWEAMVIEILIAAFGLTPTLYLIFYAGHSMGESFMEIWSPSDKHKPSKVFSLVQATDQSNPLPINRHDTCVMELNNWY